MIPLQLTLRNFLSYGPTETVVDLEGLRLVCVCGPNGVGKSALLDAMIWALYGVSRMGGSKYKELIRKGAKEAQVSLTFELEGERFFVDRKVREKGHEVTLSHIIEPGILKPVAQGEAAEKALMNLLRLNSGSFLASVFLQQGESDLFSSADPRNRRKILGNILELEVYDELTKEVREDAKSKRNRASDKLQMAGDLESREAELVKQQQSLSQLGQMLQEKQRTRDTVMADLDEHREKLNRLANQLEEIKEKKLRWGKIEKDLEEIAREIKKNQEQLIEFQGEIEKIPQLKEKEQQLHALNLELDDLHTKRERLLKIDKCLSDMRLEENERRSRFENQIGMLENRRDNLEEKIIPLKLIQGDEARIRNEHKELIAQSVALEEMRQKEKRLGELKNELKEVEDQITTARHELEKQISALQSQRAMLQKKLKREGMLFTLHQELQAYQEKREWLAKQIQELEIMKTETEKKLELRRGEYKEKKNRVEILNRQLKKLEHADNCPLCLRQFDETSRTEALTQSGQEYKSLIKEIDQMTADGTHLKEELEILLENLHSLQAQLQVLPDSSGQLFNVEKELLEIGATKGEDLQLISSILAIESQLTDGSFASGLLARTISLQEIIIELGFDPVTKRALEDIVIKLSPVQKDLAVLEEAAEDLPKLQTALVTLNAEIDAKRKELVDGHWKMDLEEESIRLLAEKNGIVLDEMRFNLITAQVRKWSEIPKQLALAEATVSQEVILSENISRDRQKMLDWQKDAQVLERELADEQHLLEDLEEVQVHFLEMKRLHSEMDLELSDLQQTFGQARAREQELEDSIQTSKDFLKEASNLDHQARVTSLVADMFSPTGIPHLIISSVLPVLSTAATELLQHLSDDAQAGVQILAQKAKASGELVDSLDVIITDRNGERDYRLYSGGESFRIDIALRVALARLLTMRSGISIRTLVVDEGFGTQDNDGLDRLAAAVHTLSLSDAGRSYFDLIMVVTHVEELKNRFEQLLLVEKDINGYSTVQRIG